MAGSGRKRNGRPVKARSSKQTNYVGWPSAHQHARWWPRPDGECLPEPRRRVVVTGVGELQPTLCLMSQTPTLDRLHVRYVYAIV